MSIESARFARLRRNSVRAIALGLLAICSREATADAPRASLAQEVDVPQLIEQLGHPSYAARVRAREALERLGLQAFDDLHAAQYSPDVEVAATARYLVSSLLVSWSIESDPPGVREALHEYGAQSETERQNRMDRLAELPRRQGLAALVRLARFETSLKLSREAGLAVMRGPMPEDPAVRKAQAETIRDVLGRNERQAAQWLRVYAEDLERGEYAAEKWKSLVLQQRQAVEHGGDSLTTRPAVLELIRVCATRAVAAGMREEALALVSAHLDLVPPRSLEVLDACSWAIDNGMHDLVLQLRERNPELFARQPILLYGAAEALLATGAGEQAADALAAQAAAVDPVPPEGSEQATRMSPKALEELAYRHREIGRELESRGLFRWAEREYRHIIDTMPIDTLIAAAARTQLAMMFGDLLRFQEGYETLEPLIRRAEEDQTFARRLQAQFINVNRMKSTMLYYRGLVEAKSEEPEQRQAAQQTLLAALELDPINVDILIAMYRLDGDPVWREDVRRRIRSLEVTFRNQIEAISQQIQLRVRFPDMVERLAEHYNQYAWLISNTEGDQQQALQYSLRSLELSPNEPALLDTAGRCYFAIGDLESALRVQRRAVKLMPHSPPLTRQLAEFEAAAQSEQQDREQHPEQAPEQEPSADGDRESPS